MSSPDTKTTASVLRLAPIQYIESKQDLASLTPKDCFIPAEPVERVARQIGQTQKATGEVGGGINLFQSSAGRGFRFVGDALRCTIGVGIDRSPPESRIDNIL